VTGSAGCLGGGTPAGESDNTGAKTGLKVGQKLPDFTLQTTEGNEVSLHPVEKPTALFFMAAWCTSCKQEEHNLKQVHETFGDKVRLISIDMDPDRDSMQDLQQFKEQYGGEWTHTMGTKELIQTYRLTSLDTTYIIDQDGMSTYKDSDVTPASTFESEFKKIL
jgi:peroxiredoxin